MLRNSEPHSFWTYSESTQGATAQISNLSKKVGGITRFQRKFIMMGYKLVSDLQRTTRSSGNLALCQNGVIAMPQAHADPAEIRRFAMQLKQFQQNMTQQMGAIHGQLQNLGQSWRDHEHDKFASEFEQAAIALRKFLETSEAHIPFLLRKADRLDEYLGQH
jgi:uncharacterized protein YukE